MSENKNPANGDGTPGGAGSNKRADVKLSPDIATWQPDAPTNDATDIDSHTIPVTLYSSSYISVACCEKLSLPELCCKIISTVVLEKSKSPWLSLYDNERVEVTGINAGYDQELTSFETTCEVVKNANVRALLYVGPHHLRATPKLRILVPFSEPLSPEKLPAMAARLNGLFRGQLTPESFKPSSYPYGSVGDQQIEAAHIDGDFINLRDDLDAGAIDIGSVENVDQDAGTSERPPSPSDVAVDAEVAKLNESFALVVVGDTTAVLKTSDNDIGFLKVSAFEQWHVNCHVVRHDKRVPLGRYWLTHPQRRQYKGITFSPAREVPGQFNLWRGFSVEPKPGDCSKFLAHIKDNVCRGNESHYQWVIGWFADIVQHPDRKIGTSLVLRGEQGTGKTKVGEVFGSLFRPHYLLVSAPHLITGRFNSHLVSCLLLHADEGFWAGDHAAEGKLKDLITGEHQLIEFKGKEPVRVRNYVRLLVTGNSEWLVPAGFGERRFATLDMGRDHEKDNKYFAAIDDEMNNGGRQALLYHLQNFDLTKVDLRTIPKTEALFEQQLSSLTPEQSWWLDTLMRGELPRGCNENGRCPTDRLFDRYISRSMRQGARRRSIEVQLGTFLGKHVSGLKKIKTTYQRWNGSMMADDFGPIYVFPSLKECRDAFAKKLGQPINWEEDGADWTTEPVPDPSDCEVTF